MYFCFMGREIRARKYRLVPKAGLGYPLGHRLFFFFVSFLNLICVARIVVELQLVNLRLDMPSFLNLGNYRLYSQKSALRAFLCKNNQPMICQYILS